MRKVTVLLLLMCFSVSFHAQTIDLSKMSVKQRDEYLINLSREVVMNFGPDYYREYKMPTVSEVKVFHDSTNHRPEILRNIGRKYYRVTYLYDKAKELFACNYAAQVDIWADDGEPKNVQFGSGWRIEFAGHPYRKWVKEGIKNNEKVPFQSAPPSSNGQLIYF